MPLQEPLLRVFNEHSNDVQVDRLRTCGSLVIDV